MSSSSSVQCRFVLVLADKALTWNTIIQFSVIPTMVTKLPFRWIWIRFHVRTEQQEKELEVDKLAFRHLNPVIRWMSIIRQTKVNSQPCNNHLGELQFRCHKSNDGRWSCKPLKTWKWKSEEKKVSPTELQSENEAQSALERNKSA